MTKTYKDRFVSNLIWRSFYVLAFVAVYFLSEYLLSFYIYGDQFHYTNFYFRLRGASAAEVPSIQYSTTGSAEPFYGYLIWLASNAGMEKTPLIAVFNGLFAALIAATVRKLGGSILLVAIIFSNYYFIVLITAAERLKFSYIVFCLAILFGGFLGKLLFFTTPLVHLQSALTIVSVISARFVDAIAFQAKGLSWSRIRSLIGLIALAVLGLLAFLRLQERIIGKFQSYSELGEGVYGTLEIVVLTAASVIISRRKIEAVLFFAPLVLAAAVLGGSRVNMIGFVMLMYIGLKNGRSLHPILLSLYVYFGYRTVGFIDNIFAFGVGFV